MKKLLILILAVFTFEISNAQFLSIAIELKPDSQITDLDFSCTKVIDGRINKNSIGQIYRDRKKIEIHFINEFTEHIKDATDFILPDSPEKDKLVLIFKELSVFEKSDVTGKYGTCNVKIEVAKQIDSSLYSLGTFNSSTTDTKGNIQYTHGRRIIKSIKECLRKFNETDWKNTAGELIEREDSVLSFDYTSIPPKGIYLSYNQLCNKSPIDSLNFDMILSNNSKQFPTYKAEMNNTLIKEQAIFISDGKSLYMRSNQTQFVKAISFGKYIYFQGKIATKSKSSEYIPAAAIGGGLIGVAIFTTASNNTKAGGVVLETETGQLKIVTDLYLLRITEPFPLMLKAYRKSRRKLDDKRDVLVKLNSMYK
ncbi:MAG: hypothetical protein ACPGSO_04765 [Vicingaceae bacterium]